MFDKLSVLEILTKIEGMEQEIKEVKKELRRRLEVDQNVETVTLLTMLKAKWDAGLRSKDSPRGTYFRVKDICACGERELISMLYDYSGGRGADLQICVGKSLTKLMNKTVIVGDKRVVLERYVVNGASAYRFVETE